MRFQEFYDYLMMRERIRIAKAEGKPWPWTEDPILQKYKFTNVRREHDRTSMEMRRFYTTHFKAAPELVWLNCTIARYFGTYEFQKALGWQTDFKPDVIKKLAKTRLSEGERVFTGAYVITNQGISAPKQEVVVDHFVKGVWDARKRLSAVVKSTGKWQDTLAVLSEIPGFGGSGFMGKEVTLDTMFFMDFWPEKVGRGASRPRDYWDWTPIGPGAQRGLVRVLGGNPRVNPSLRRGVGLSDLMALAAKQKEAGWPVAWGKLAPTDIQFGLCEFDKFERTNNGEGKPRSKYERPE